MTISYKIDVLAKLKECGYSTYRIRKENIIGQSTITRLNKSKPVSWDNISIICKLLSCQPGDIVEFIPEEEGNADKKT